MNLPIKKILFATDLTKDSRKAFSWLIPFARQNSSGIVLLYVIEKLLESTEKSLETFLGKQEWKRIKEKQENDVRSILIGKKTQAGTLKDALQSRFETVGTPDTSDNSLANQVIISNGKPAEEILKQSEENDCDIIVMALGKKDNIEGSLFGRTTNNVLKKSKKPVLLIPTE